MWSSAKAWSRSWVLVHVPCPWSTQPPCSLGREKKKKGAACLRASITSPKTWPRWKAGVREGAGGERTQALGREGLASAVRPAQHTEDQSNVSHLGVLGMVGLPAKRET